MMSDDDYYMSIARVVAEKSKDRSTKVGAVIVGPDKEIRSTGRNGFPRGINDDINERHERPAKYFWSEHAERNSILQAAMVGTPLKGCKIYVTAWPCADCSRAIIQAGICEVIAPKPDEEFYERWKESMDAGLAMFREAGVVARAYEEVTE